jgi:hypothetical protein
VLVNQLPLSHEHLTDVSLLVEFTPTPTTKLFTYRSTKAQLQVLRAGNDLADFSFLPFAVFSLKRSQVTLQIVPKATGTFRVLAVFFKVFNIPRFFPFDNQFNVLDNFVSYIHGGHPSLPLPAPKHTRPHLFVNKCKENGSINYFCVHQAIGKMAVATVLPSDQFVFGQFKTLTVKLTRQNNLPIESILMFSSNPLATGFLVREIPVDSEGVSQPLEIVVRATLSHRKNDSVDLLLVVRAAGFVRLSVAAFEFKVNNSFKTKCVHEDIGNNRLLVGVDIFESREPNIQPMAFTVKAMALLSETHKLDPKALMLPAPQANLIAFQKMIYFIINLQSDSQAQPRERADHRVCYREENVTRSDSELNPFLENMSLQNLIGFFDQESRSIRFEFRSMITKIRQKFDCTVKLPCDEFLDFAILWSYQNIGLFGRESTVFSPENDPEIRGIHSILSTPLNMLSFRFKKTKPLTPPTFSLVIIGPKVVHHDFQRQRFCHQVLQNQSQADCQVPVHARSRRPSVPAAGEQHVSLSVALKRGRANRYRSSLGLAIK